MGRQEDGQSKDGTEQTGTNLRGELDQVRIIATGGMSQIFRAHQPSLDRYIVVKKLKDELQANPETVERFRREAKALASVLHQNVAHVYDFVEGENESYILMEYIDGVDLSHVVEKVGSVPAEVAACILLCVAKGVSYIHAHNLIHRDIKPSNIRLTTRGEVKLMDFGIVMSIENQGLTRPGMMVGSPSYLSPEQVLGDTIDGKADVFLMGICLYEMLTGTRPFRDEGQETIFHRIREAKFVPIRNMQRNVPPLLEGIVHRCLRKEPGRRYKSMKEVMAELEKFLGPTKSSHTEDIILKYLDDEALLSPAVPYASIVDQRTFRELISWQVVGTFLLSLLSAFVVGWLLGRASRSLFSFSSPTSAGEEITFAPNSRPGGLTARVEKMGYPKPRPLAHPTYPPSSKFSK
jgi:serine/threonine protein kinase